MASTTSLTVTDSARATRRTCSSGTWVHATDRLGPTRPVRGRRGAACPRRRRTTVDATSTTAPTAPATTPGVDEEGAGLPEPAATCPIRAVVPAATRSRTPLARAGRHGGAGGSGRGSGVGSRSRTANSSSAVPSSSTWLAFRTNATRSPLRPSRSRISQRGRSGSRGCSRMRATASRELGVATGSGHRVGAEVVGDVEVVVVLPRHALGQRQLTDPLTEAGRVAQDGLHALGQVVEPERPRRVAQGRGLEHGQAGDLEGHLGPLDPPQHRILRVQQLEWHGSIFDPDPPHGKGPVPACAVTSCSFATRSRRGTTPRSPTVSVRSRLVASRRCRACATTWPTPRHRPQVVLCSLVASHP